MVKLDEQVLFWLNSFAGHSVVFDWIVIFCAQYVAYLLPIMFLFFISRSENARVWGKIFFAACTTTILSRGIVTPLIRLVYPRERPFVFNHVTKLIPESGSGFPSGHAAFFFALAAVVWHYDRRWGIGFFVASVVMGIARVMAGVHWPTDIVGGFVVAMLSAYIVIRFASRKVRSVA